MVKNNEIFLVANIEKKEDNSGASQNTDENNFMKLFSMQQNKPMLQTQIPNNYMNIKPSIQSQGIPLMTNQGTDNQLLTFLLMQNSQNNKPVTSTSVCGAS